MTAVGSLASNISPTSQRWYAPISLCTDNISGTQKHVDPPIGRENGILGHCHICWTPTERLAPTGINGIFHPREAGCEHWVCLIFHPIVVLIRNHFIIDTPTYLSTGHLTSNPGPFAPPLLNVFHHTSNQSTTFSPTFIILLVIPLVPTAHNIK